MTQPFKKTFSQKVEALKLEFKTKKTIEPGDEKFLYDMHLNRRLSDPVYIDYEYNKFNGWDKTPLKDIFIAPISKPEDVISFMALLEVNVQFAHNTYRQILLNFRIKYLSYHYKKIMTKAFLSLPDDKQVGFSKSSQLSVITHGHDAKCPCIFCDMLVAEIPFELFKPHYDYMCETSLKFLRAMWRESGIPVTSLAQFFKLPQVPDQFFVRCFYAVLIKGVEYTPATILELGSLHAKVANDIGFISLTSKVLEFHLNRKSKLREDALKAELESVREESATQSSVHIEELLEQQPIKVQTLEEHNIEELKNKYEQLIGDLQKQIGLQNFEIETGIQRIELLKGSQEKLKIENDSLKEIAHLKGQKTKQEGDLTEQIKIQGDQIIYLKKIFEDSKKEINSLKDQNRELNEQKKDALDQVEKLKLGSVESDKTLKDMKEKLSIEENKTRNLESTVKELADTTLLTIQKSDEEHKKKDELIKNLGEVILNKDEEIQNLKVKNFLLTTKLKGASEVAEKHHKDEFSDKDHEPQTPVSKADEVTNLRLADIELKFLELSKKMDRVMDEHIDVKVDVKYCDKAVKAQTDIQHNMSLSLKEMEKNQKEFTEKITAVFKVEATRLEKIVLLDQTKIRKEMSTIGSYIANKILFNKAGSQFFDMSVKDVYTTFLSNLKDSTIKEITDGASVFLDQMAVEKEKMVTISKKLEKQFIPFEKELKKEGVEPIRVKIHNRPMYRPKYHLEVRKEVAQEQNINPDLKRGRSEKYFENSALRHLKEAFAEKDYLDVSKFKVYDDRMTNSEWELQKTLNSYFCLRR
jgi:hypothetical protein